MTRAESPRSTPRLGLALIFALALVLRVTVALQYDAHHPQADAPVIDEASYDEWGARIAGGEWMGAEVFFQEPLYPYTLGVVYAVFGHDRGAARIVQCVLGALTAVLVALLAARMFGRNAGLVAGFAAAVYRPTLLFPSLLLKPTLFLLVLTALVLVLLSTREHDSKRRWIVVGVLAGLGALLRGNLFVMLPWILAWPIARALMRAQPMAPAVWHSLAALAGVLLVLLPVAARNAHVGGVFVLTTSGAGTNFYGGNNADNLYGVATEFPWVRGIPEFEADDWAREAERRSGSELAPDEVSDFWMSAALTSMRENPGMHVRILWNKLRLTLGAYEVPDNHHLDWDARRVALLRAPFGGWGLWGCLGLAGALHLLWMRRRGDSIELLILTGLYLGTIVLTVTSMRIRLALVPLLLPFAAAFCVACANAWRARDAAAWKRLVPALLLAGVIVHVPIFDASQREEDYAERDFNHAVQLLRAGDVDTAYSIGQEIEASYPKSSRVQSLLAECELFDSRAEQARARLADLVQQSSLSERERFRMRSLLARASLMLGERVEATRYLRSALEFDGSDARLVLDLARTHLLLLADPAVSEPDKLAGAREALAHLREVCRDTSQSEAVRRQARVTAALLLIEPLVLNWQAAQNHLRAALALGGAAEVEWLLAFALWQGGAASPEEKIEAENLLIPLTQSSSARPEWRTLLDEIRASGD
jgi:4-amino-4-deoxy-L-arabinose transferase-like glycosyltransferase